MAEVKPKSPLQLLIILIVVSLSLAGGLFYLLKKEQAKSLVLQGELEDIKTRQRITEAKLDESRKIMSTLETELQKAKTQIDTLSSDLEKEKTAKEEVLSEIEQLKADLEQQKSLRTSLEGRLTQAQDDMAKVRDQLKELEAKKAELETKIKEAEAQKATASGVELGKIIVSPEAGVPKERESAPAKPAVKKAEKKQAQKESPAISSGLEGKVLVINKEYNFAVINLGSKDGVDLGNIFSVYHDNKYLGDLKVEKVHDSMSAGGFVSSDIKDKINEGDKVIQKTK